MALTRKEYDEGEPVRQYCEDCETSLCVECGLSACHDVHDGSGAGRHPYNDGQCRALVLYVPDFQHEFQYDYFQSLMASTAYLGTFEEQMKRGVA
jgi:hypothetical protein